MPSSFPQGGRESREKAEEYSKLLRNDADLVTMQSLGREWIGPRSEGVQTKLYRGKVDEKRSTNLNTDTSTYTSQKKQKRATG